MDEVTKFYDNWAVQQMHDKKRATVLQWKAINFLNLLLRNNFDSFEKVAEIGGAEGILLHTLDSNIAIKSLNNFDISSKFCEAGKIKYPKIIFNNYEFFEKPEYFDLMMLSDITEHVENDHEFLEMVSRYCKYLVIKIPIEIAFINSGFFYSARLKRKPDEFKYGKNHINGHLRGYSIPSAKRLISKYFNIIDHEISDVSYFNPSRKKALIKNLVGKNAFIRIYGGAYFALCESLAIHH